MSTFAEQVVAAVFAVVDRQKLNGHPNALCRSTLTPLMVAEVAQLDANRTAPQTPGKPLSWPERIYAAYPRHVGKKDALKAIERAMKCVRQADAGQVEKIAASEYIFERTKAFAEAVKQWPPQDRQFIPHPATWFNQGRYADDPKEWERGNQSAAVPTNYGKF